MTDGTDRVVLPSTSLAQDAAYRGMADVAAAWRDRVDDYRVVGGHMVSVHVARFPVDVPVRGTLDTDVGMEARLLATGDPVQELRELGYTLVEGNRMSRSVNGHDAVIDILIPATGTRARHNRKVGDLFVDEAPALRYAAVAARPAYLPQLEVRLTTGAMLEYVSPIPDLVAAVCLKVAAFESRGAGKDAFDVWRLLEVAYAAGMSVDGWPAKMPTATRTAELLRRDFLNPAGGGVLAATDVPARQARIRLLTQSLVGRS